MTAKFLREVRGFYYVCYLVNAGLAPGLVYWASCRAVLLAVTRTMGFEDTTRMQDRLTEVVDRIAAERYGSEAVLGRLQVDDPCCLLNYLALYRFYADADRFREAEQAAISGLEEAARQGGFTSDWQRLARDPQRPNLRDSDAGRYYLLALKALAFAKLRGQQRRVAQAIMADLSVLDPSTRKENDVLHMLCEPSVALFKT